VDGDTLHADDCRQWEAYELARRLRGMVEGGYPVYDREDEHVRPLRYDDIAILFRSLKESPIYEEVFKAMGLPFVTVGGRGYFDRQEVWDVLNLLAALYNPADDLALAVALRSPLFGLSDDALFALRLMRDDAGHILPLWDALAAPGLLLPDDERGLSAFAYDCLSGLRATAGRVSVAELLHDVLARTQYLAVLRGLPDGARRRGNVEKLLDIAQSRVHTTLGEFNRYVNQLTDRETREGEAAVEVTGAVTLMTIHASKGLEYPVVVLADASRAGRGGNNPALMYDPQAGFGCQVYDEDENKLVNSFACRRASNYSGARDDAENRRLLYVAATRAQDTLIMSGRATETKSGGWSAQGWLGQLLETFDLYDHLAHGVDTLIPQPWGALRLTVPYGGVPEDLLAAGDSSERIVWDQGPLSRSQPLPGSAVQPALTHTVSVRRDAQVRHLAATHIADLGSAMAATGPDADYFRDRFRRQVLQDSPAYVESGLVRQQGFNRTVGEIVHEALRWWRFPATVAADFDYMRMLRSYAQRFGVTDEDQIKIMANAAFRMLDRFQQSDVYGWVGGGDRIYRELPFIYEREGRIIHGIIDTLFRQPDGTWVILDYKTSYVDRSVGQSRAAEMHATRYHLQLGVYADAVTAQLDGAVPQTYIHYVRYGLTVRIAEADRRRALAQGLSERIVALLADRI
jgi:ATP-dependent helicase/nuclease subunit A